MLQANADADSAYIRDVTSGDVIDGVRFEPWWACAACNKLRPQSSFKIKLRPSQTKHLGYAGNHALDTYEKRCRDCRPKARKVTELPNKQIIKRMQNGDLSEFVGRSVIEERQRTVKQKRADATAKRWEQVRVKEWRLLIQSMRREFNNWAVIKFRVEERNKKGPWRAQRGFATLLIEYVRLLETTRNDFKRQISGLGLSKLERGQFPMKGKAWPEYVALDDIARIREIWEGLPRNVHGFIDTDTLAKTLPPLILRRKDWVPPEFPPRELKPDPLKAASRNAAQLPEGKDRDEQDAKEMALLALNHERNDRLAQLASNKQATPLRKKRARLELTAPPMRQGADDVVFSKTKTFDLNMDEE